MSLIISVAPSVSELVVTTAEAKAHLRISSATDDTYIAALVKVAVDESEDYTQRRFITQKWKYTLHDFPACGVIALPWAPITAIDSIKYYDENGTLTTWAADQYQVSLQGTQSAPTMVRLAPAVYVWPSTQLRRHDAVEIVFTVGYADSAAVPQRIKEAILLQVAEMYSVRHPVEHKFGILTTTERLLYPYRIMEFL